MDEITQIYYSIVSTCISLVEQKIDGVDLTGNVNFATIFAQSKAEFEKYNKILSENSTVFDPQITGTYYRLNTPLVFAGKSISICRVRKPDEDHLELGYCDFEVKDFAAFARKYSQREHFRMLNNQHGIEMVGLQIPNSNVRIYFPNTWSY